MRYEDASHTSAFQGQGPIANDDSDQLAAGSKSTATGNLITGEGTQTGSAGADSATDGHITAIAGKGGEDSSFAGGKLSVMGEFGKLSVDADGNYVYQANKGVENVRDRFTYTLADNNGASDTASLIVEIGKTPFAVKADAQQIVVGPDGVVTLPAGVELSDVHVVGRNLVVDMPDGTQLIIIDGAVFVPQLVLNGVEVPATNVAALLIGQEVQPAAGETPPSSGGNFAVPPPPLDPGVPLGDLIPPTEYTYKPPEPQPPLDIQDSEPEIQIQPDGQPAAVNAIDSVDEKGLPTRLGGEPEGSGEEAAAGANGDPSEATAGTILIDSPDGVDSVTINGFVVTGAIGQTIPGAYGTLTITGFAGNNILYSYVLNDNISHSDANPDADNFAVVLTDNDGDQASATLHIDIIDDVPTARPDTDTVGIGGFLATGNVVTDAALGDLGDSDTNAADTVGADNARVTFIDSVNAAPGANVPDGSFVDIAGQYGTLRIFSNGDYVYTRSPQSPGGVNDVFNYTLTDTDGDTSVTTLTITIPDTPLVTPFSIGIAFDDDAQPGGIPGGVGDESLVDLKTFSAVVPVSGGDGALTFALLASGAPPGFTYVLSNGDLLIQQGGATVITVTINAATGAYTITQIAPIDHPAGNNENNLEFSIGVRVTDADGDFVEGFGLLTVDDDSPTMNFADVSLPTLHVDETVLGTNDSGDFSVVFNGAYGADGPGSTSYAVSTVNGTDSGLVDTATGLPVLLYNIAGVVTGSTSATLGGVDAGNTVFTVSVNSGTGVVTLDQIRAVIHPDPTNNDDPVSPSATSIQLTATITDHDGDTDSLAVNIGNSLVMDDDGPSVTLSGAGEPTLIVDESNFGGDAGPTSFAGLFNFDFGADGPATSNSIQFNLGFNPGSTGLVDSLSGLPVVLSLESGQVVGRAGAGGAIVFTISVNADGGVSLDQSRAVIHPDPTNPDDDITFSDDNLITLSATVTDKDGDTATIGTPIAIAQDFHFHDDGPTAVASAAGFSISHDETAGNQADANDVTGPLAQFAGVANKGDDPDVAGSNPLGFAIGTGTISSTGSTYGADGAGTTAFSLSISSAGVDSGVNTTSGADIFLFKEGALVVGRVGDANGPAAFALAIDSATGQISMVQYLSIQQTNTGSPDESISLTNSVVQATVTVTDKDGDPAVNSVNIGNLVSFQDDGPSANNDTDTTDSVTDTAVGNVITGVGTTEGAANADQPHVDGFGSISNLVGFGGSSDNNPAGGFTVNGQFGSLQMDANGNYTYTRTDGLGGGQSEVFTYTYVDGDGDPATATLTINIADEAPVAGTVNIALDDDVIPGANGILDGVGDDDPDVVGQNSSAGTLPGSGGDGALTFGFGTNVAPAGFTYDTSVANTLLIKQGSTTVITITINPTTGAYTVTQNNPIDHVAGLDENNQTFAIDYTVKDIDTDTAHGTININVDDDSPVAAIVATGQNVSVDETVGVQVDSNDVAGPLAIFNGVANKGVDPDMAAQFAANASAIVAATGSAYGADGAGTTVFSLSVAPGGVDSGLDTTAGVNIFLFLEGGLVVGRVGATAGVAAAGPAAFALAIDPSTGAISMVEYLSILHTNTGSNDESTSIANTAVQAVVTVTDGDGDPATQSINIGSHIQFQDDGPTAAIATTGQGVSIDESVGNQVDSNDVTGPLAAFAGVANVGDDPDVAGTGPIQFAANANPLVNSTGSAYGSDGAGTTVFSLNVSAPGVDSGLDTTSGQSIFLFKEGNVIVGRVTNGAGPAAFAIAIDPVTGAVSMVEYLSILHTNALNPDDSVSIANGAIQATVTVTDGDSDPATQSVNIGSLLSFQDSGPVMTAASNINIENDATPTFSGVFAFNLGADGAPTSNDVIKTVVATFTVNGDPVTNPVLTAGVENATTASYTFSFDYANGPSSTAHETGTLVFDKVAGTYTVTLDDAISGFTTVSTSDASTTFDEFDLNGGAPEIVNAQLATNLFAQFTAVARPNGGGAHLSTTVGGDAVWNPGEFFNAAQGNPQVSNTDAGVNGNTMDTGEALKFNLYNTDPGGVVGGTPTAQASDMFIQFFQYAGDDLIIVLNLGRDSNNDGTLDTFTTRAVMVSATDVFVSGNAADTAEAAGTAYAGLVAGLGNQDALLVIEANDYNAAGENWVIVGGQIVTDEDGVSGTAIDLNKALGTDGASDRNGDGSFTSTAVPATDELDNFSEDGDVSGVKITSIGFLVQNSVDQVAHMTFDVTVQDGDGDTITQTIAVDVTDDPNSSTPISLSAAVTTVVPVALDLNGDGVQFLGTDAGVHYDYGNGSVSTAWVGANDGILVRDANGSGTVDGGSEIVFGGNGQTDLQGLAAQYGATLDANDADFSNFAVWQDANSNGVVDTGELQSLTARGITSINLTSDSVGYSAAGGDVEVAGSSTYTRADGSTGVIADASFLTGDRAASEQRDLNGSGSTIAIAAAVAAAGLAASQATAAPADDHADQAEDAPAAQASASVAPAASDDSADASRSALSNESKEAANDDASSSASSNLADDSQSHHSLDDGQASAPASSSGPAADNDQGPASVSADANPVAPAVAMVSAEALQAAGLDGNVQHGGSVEKIIVEALGQGNGNGAVDALLDAFHGGNGGGAAIANMASAPSGAVSAWDMASNGGSSGANEMLMKVGAEMLHHDAVQPTHNG